MTMPDGNSAAESRHAHETAKRQELAEDFCERALEDLVWRMMDGQDYPLQGREQINLTQLLCEADAFDVAEAICYALQNRFAGEGLRDQIEALVTVYLADSKWHERRIAEMIEEARDEQE